jgi:glycosyltransferase involved in cell wall biosynthesis
LKILTVTYALGVGGVARTAQIFAEGYHSLGIDSRVLSITAGGLREQALIRNGITVWNGADEDILQEILDWNPDVIHLHSHSFGEKELAFLDRLFPGRITVEKNIFSRPVAWTSRMDRSYQLSAWCAWRFCRLAPELAPKATIVPNGADSSAFRRASADQTAAFRAEHNIPESAPVIGRIGQHYDTKWSPVLINAFNHLAAKNPDLHLLLISPSEPIRQQAGRSPFANRITLIELLIGDDTLSIAYSAMDLFALAADQGESFGNVLAESMLCETPVVALSTPWQDNSQCEVVGHNVGGLIALTPKGFERALDTLLRDEPRRREMGRAGRKRVIEKFERLKVAQRSLDAIEGRQPPLSIPDLDRQIIEIYKDAFEKASPLTLWILKDKRFLRLTRYTTHYRSIARLPLELLKIISARLLPRKKS